MILDVRRMNFVPKNAGILLKKSAIYHKENLVFIPKLSACLLDPIG
jgi:hypothetical protein